MPTTTDFDQHIADHERGTLPPLGTCECVTCNEHDDAGDRTALMRGLLIGFTVSGLFFWAPVIAAGVAVTR